MSKQKSEMPIDNSQTYLETTLRCFEEIKSIINNIHDEPDFLILENIGLLKTHIDLYKNKHTLLSEKEIQLFTRCKQLPSTKTLTLEEIKLKQKVAEIKERPQRRNRFIEMLNDTQNNVFYELLQKYPGKESLIEDINKDWIERSHYADVQSGILPLLANSFTRMEEYFSDLILKDKNLPLLLEKYKIKINVKAQAKQMINLIHYEKECLSQAMLSRLKMAKAKCQDDVVLVTLEAINKIMIVANTNKIKSYSFEEPLTSSLRVQFYEYIKQVGTKRQLAELAVVYPLDYVDEPCITNLKTEALISLSENCNMNFLNFDCFALNKMNFSKQTLIKASFESGFIQDSNLQNTHFQWSNFNRTTFNNVNAQHAEFYSSDFSYSVFNTVNAKNAQFCLSTFNQWSFNTLNAQQANFTSAYFVKADLQWVYAELAIFKASTITHTSFHGGYLYGANFERVKLDSVDYTLCCLERSIFYGAMGACTFDSANLKGANLIKMNLSKASFKGCILVDTKFLEGESEDDVVSELDLLECQLKNHASRLPLRVAIKQDVERKIEDKKWTKSTLLQHSLFARKWDNTENNTSYLDALTKQLTFSLKALLQ